MAGDLLTLCAYNVENLFISLEYADGHDFEPIVPYLGVDDLGVRFVFPHAPRRAVSLNMGLLMPAWFDVASTDFESGLDEPGIGVSATAIGIPGGEVWRTKRYVRHIYPPGDSVASVSTGIAGLL